MVNLLGVRPYPAQCRVQTRSHAAVLLSVILKTPDLSTPHRWLYMRLKCFGGDNSCVHPVSLPRSVTDASRPPQSQSSHRARIPCRHSSRAKHNTTELTPLCAVNTITSHVHGRMDCKDEYSGKNKALSAPPSAPPSLTVPHDQAQVKAPFLPPNWPGRLESGSRIVVVNTSIEPKIYRGKFLTRRPFRIASCAA